MKPESSLKRVYKVILYQMQNIWNTCIFLQVVHIIINHTQHAFIVIYLLFSSYHITGAQLSQQADLVSPN